MGARKTESANGIVMLKPVGVTDDGAALLLGRRARGRPVFKLAVDPALVAHLQLAVERARGGGEGSGGDGEPKAPEVRDPAAPETSSLTPKEIQALLREGRSVEAIADEAGVKPAWVERFEGPIVWERAGMAMRAQKATMVRTRAGASAMPLRDAVEANLRLRKIVLEPEALADSWDSVKLTATGHWLVRFSFSGRGQRRVAEWDFDPESETLRPANHLGSELGWVQPKGRKARAQVD